jgi:hypothetical protein
LLAVNAIDQCAAIVRRGSTVPDEGNAVVIPATLIEQLTEALAKWDGRGPTPDDDFEAGKRMASAIMALLVWNTNASPEGD